MTAGPAHATDAVGRGRRIAAVLVLIVGFAGLVVLAESDDRRPGPPNEEEAAALAAELAATPVDAASLAPLAPPATALGSTWYCAAGTATDDGGFDHVVAIANPSPEPVTASITAFPGALDGDVEAEAAVAALEPVSEDVDVPAYGLARVRVGTLLAAPFAGALVEVDGGQVAVEHSVNGQSDLGHSPCAAAPSDTWYLATGTTTRDAQELLVLFNPFPDDAVADITFTTTEGARAPEQYEGLVVPALRVLVLDLGLTVGRHADVATEVTTRSGRLVVDRLQSFDGSDGPAGRDVTLASTHAAPLWHWAEGFVTGGLTESISVYNPSDRQAEVDVEVLLDDPATNGAVEPFILSLPPNGIARVVLSAEDRVPPDVGHAIVVRSQNGVPVIAERWERSGAPAPRAGFAATVGSPVLATQWLLPAGSTTGGIAEFLVAANPSTVSEARMTVQALVGGQLLPVDGLGNVAIRPAGRIAIDLGTRINREDLALLIESTEPIVVERGIYRGSSGFSQMMGIATADSVVIASADVEE